MPHIEPGSPQARPAGILKQHQEQSHDDQQHQPRQVPDTADFTSPQPWFGLINYSVSPRSTPKSVSIAQYAETISPLILGRQKSVEDLHFSIVRDLKMPSVKSPRSQRLSGRVSNSASPALLPLTPQALAVDDPEATMDGFPFEVQPQADRFDSLVDQISAWIKNERAKGSKRKQSKDARQDDKVIPDHLQSTGGTTERRRRGSDASNKSLDLDKLESIIKQNLNISRHRGSLGARRKPSIRKLRRKPSSTSDSEHHDGDILVPSCDVVLDNSRTFASNGGAPESDVSSSDELKHAPSYRDYDAWANFKFEIVRLAHTLRLKGWRRVPMELSSEITVQRLSGALTNAVYVVSPPQDLPDPDNNGNSQGPRRAPPKLLLRIYGPQVEHLIDREAELAILRRLARKHIGPRLLGTFANGRFEEYFHARTLTAEDLRNPDTSRQIAKRTRELHDGVELLDQERSDGPFVWRNWDKWVRRVERIVSWMDKQIEALEPGVKPTGAKAWMRRGFICGVPWQTFKEAVDKYRQWLEVQCGGLKQVKNQLVFSHNDTQYGNILRMMPTGESPLLLPANSHKQLVVIDFEYSSANAPGLEIANHFTEWCYNYHDKRKPYACNTNRYPTPEEQDRFIRSYVRHRPQFNVNTPKLGPVSSYGEPPSPATEPPKRLTSRISDMMLDRRNPLSLTPTADDAAAKAAEDAEVARLMHETRLWRLANTAQWVAWGIVQAKVPGMPLFDDDDANSNDKPTTGEPSSSSSPSPKDSATGAVEDGAHKLLATEAQELKAAASQPQQQKDTPTPAIQRQEEEQEEFDYLGYAQHRAMFFWGDALQMGLARPEDIPAEMKGKVKTVPY